MILNNRLSAEYIKKIFHFMKVNNVDEIKVGNIIFKKDYQYTIKIIKNNNIKENFYDNEVKGLVETIKRSKYYLMTFIKESDKIEN